MKGVTVGLLVAAAIVLLIVGVAGAVFYVKVYQPIGGPLMAISGAKALEDKRLTSQGEFQPPVSGELTAEQVAGFVDVEEAVQRQWPAAIAVLGKKRAELEEANDDGALSAQAALAAFGDIRRPYVAAKVAQIDAMNRANLSKDEFEWVRRQLYSAAGLRLLQLDVSDVAAGVPDAMVSVRPFSPTAEVPEQNKRLAQPVAEKLKAWLSLGFFGL